MNQEPANSNSINELPRCQKHTRNGRCRMLVADTSSTFCADHGRASVNHSGRRRAYRTDRSDDGGTDGESVDTQTCPRCGKEVYEQAEQCPHCREYISEEERSERPKPARTFVVAMIVIAIIAGWVLSRH